MALSRFPLLVAMIVTTFRGFRGEHRKGDPAFKIQDSKFKNSSKPSGIGLWLEIGLRLSRFLLNLGF